MRGGDAGASPIIGLSSQRKASSSFAIESLQLSAIKEKANLPSNESTNVATQPRKSFKNLWFIHGKYYDLEPFIKSHPGGQAILILSRGIPDATPLMESYHAFANKEYIAKTLSKYEVNYIPEGAGTRKSTEIKYTFKEGGFYDTLTRRVRVHFGATKMGESVSANVKANRWWAVKILTQTLVLTGSYLTAFVLPVDNFAVKAISAVVAGVSVVALGMQCMHDSSHYAVATRNSWKNRFLLRIWNAVALWGSDQWLQHHTVLHHSFTGDDEFDPDTMHAKPFVRKTLLAKRSKYFSFPAVLAAERWFWAFYSLLIYTLLPGMYVGQVISYRILWPLKGRLWKMSSVPKDALPRANWETALSWLVVLAQLYRRSPLLSFIFFTACNISYAMCIIPDHDTFESAIQNHVNDGEVDWGEVQVRHSSDFGGKGFLGRCFTQMFGGINLQIGHHLFPSVNHVHLPELVPIIKETCAEFNVPYAEQGTVLSALWSFVRTVHACMGIEDADKKES